MRAKRRESIDHLDILLQATFLDMFGDPVTNPMGWKEVELGSIVADAKIGLVRSSKEFGTGFDIPYVRMDSITADGKFLEHKVLFTTATKKEQDDFSLLPGDVLFNTRNSKELVGKVCVFPGPSGFLFNNNIMRLRFHADVQPVVVALQFQFQRVKQELEQRKSGTTNVFAVYWKSLRTLPILVPPVERQQQYSGIVHAIEQKRRALLSHLDELNCLFASLQSGAFSGQL